MQLHVENSFLDGYLRFPNAGLQTCDLYVEITLQREGRCLAQGKLHFPLLRLCVSAAPSHQAQADTDDQHE